MKKTTLISIFILIISFISCEKNDSIQEELEQQPNNLDNLITEIQLDIPNFIEALGKMGSELTRLDYMFAPNEMYSITSESTQNNIAWDIAYLNLFPKIQEAKVLALETEEHNHLGILKVLEAYTLFTLVDFYGDVPYTEISDPNPHLDDDADIYQIAVQLLDEALQEFELDGSNLENDFYYNNDFIKWEKLANTLKMQAYLNTRLTDSEASTKFEEIVNSGNFLQNIPDDFEFNYQNSETPHPDYLLNYSPIGVGRYTSNWVMNIMQETDDPRIRYYFYRQTDCMPGNLDGNGDLCYEFPEQALLCFVDNRPNHYLDDMSFCFLDNGYWGRDHGYSEGVPPDSFSRTASGVYPSAGIFDDNQYVGVVAGLGGQGIGITPLLHASWVSFMQAEMALIENNSNIANTFIQEGMQKSIDKVMSFINLDPDADTSFAPSSTEISNYINTVSNEFSTGNTTEKWNILSEQLFISNYGNGIYSYNMYRRSGFPNTLQYTINENPGSFIRSLLYPETAINNNTNIEQKPNGAVQVFWDTNPAYPEFPYSN